MFNKQSIVHSDGATSKAAPLGELNKNAASLPPTDAQASGHVVLL